MSRAAAVDRVDSGPVLNSSESPRDDAGERRFLILALLALAGALRLVPLPARQLVEGDGAHYAALARAALSGDLSALTNPYWSNLWPAVIALTSLVSGLDTVGAGRLASLAAGVLLVCATAHLAGLLFGPRARGLAAAAAAAHPWLLHFSTLVFTETIFTLLLVVCLIAGWDAVERPRYAAAVRAALCVGLGLLTRPEAMAVAPVVAVGILAHTAAGSIRRRLAVAAAYLLVVALFPLARAAFVQRYYGFWDFGQEKAATNLFVGLSREGSDMERLIHGTNAGGESPLEVARREWPAPRFVAAHSRLVLDHVGRNLLVIGRAAAEVLPPFPGESSWHFLRSRRLAALMGFLSALSLITAGTGALLGAWDRRTRAASLFVLGVVAVYTLGLAPLYVHERLLLALTPLFLLLLAHAASLSLGALSRLLGRLAGLAAEAGIVGVFALAGLLAAPGVRSDPDAPYASDPVAQRDAGLWLRERYPQTTRVMSLSPSLAFYFYDAEHQDNERDIPWAAYPGVLAAARDAADLIAAPEWHLSSGGYPAAANLTPGGDHPGLLYQTSIGPPGPFRVHIFRVERRGSPQPPAAGR